MFPWQDSASLSTLFKALTVDLKTSANLLRFVGGCVRDFLLKKPWQDIDLATSLLPEEVIKRLQKASIPYFTSGISHGTVTAVVDKTAYEITTLRRDIQSDGRHAIVAFTEDWKIDAHRRDFTINALFMDWEGTLYDFVGGEKDLYQGRVRFVGVPEERIKEDFLRILRLFRMFAFYGKKPLEETTLKVVQKYVSEIKKLSTERIHAEFLRLLEAPNPENALALMDAYGVLREIFENLKVPSFFETLLKIEEEIQEPNPLLRLSALLLQTSKDLKSESLKSFLIMKKEINYIISMLSYKEFLLSQDPLMFSRALLYKMKLTLYRDVMILKSALLSKEKNSITLLKQILEKAEDQNELLIFPLSGKDLLSLGVKPGPFMGSLLKKAEDFWMENDCSFSKEECADYIKGDISKGFY